MNRTAKTTIARLAICVALVLVAVVFYRFRQPPLTLTERAFVGSWFQVSLPGSPRWTEFTFASDRTFRMYDGEFVGQ